MTPDRMVRELVEPNRQSTRIAEGKIHTVEADSLLNQLRRGVEPSRYQGGSGRRGFESGCPIRVEALDALALIDSEAAALVRRMGQDDDGDTEGCVRRVHSLIPSADVFTAREAERSIRRWWTLARVTTGWDSAPFRPNATCPQCGNRGGLRVKVDPLGAVCVECGAAWDQATVGLLGDHIRIEHGEAA